MGSKIQPVRLNNFRASGVILMGLFSVDATQSRDDKMGTIFTMPFTKAQTLNFKANFKFSRLKYFWGDPRPSLGMSYVALVNL